MVYFNASAGWAVRLLGVDDRGFMKVGVKTYQIPPMLLLNSPTFFFFFGLHISRLWLSLRFSVLRSSIWRLRLLRRAQVEEGDGVSPTSCRHEGRRGPYRLPQPTEPPRRKSSNKSDQQPRGRYARRGHRLEASGHPRRWAASRSWQHSQRHVGRHWPLVPGRTRTQQPDCPSTSRKNADRLPGSISDKRHRVW